MTRYSLTPLARLRLARLVHDLDTTLYATLILFRDMHVTAQKFSNTARETAAKAQAATVSEPSDLAAITRTTAAKPHTTAQSTSE